MPVGENNCFPSDLKRIFALGFGLGDCSLDVQACLGLSNWVRSFGFVGMLGAPLKWAFAGL